MRVRSRASRSRASSAARSVDLAMGADGYPAPCALVKANAAPSALAFDEIAHQRRRRADAGEPELVHGARRTDVQPPPRRRRVGELARADLDQDHVVELEAFHLLDLGDLDARREAEVLLL